MFKLPDSPFRFVVKLALAATAMMLVLSVAPIADAQTNYPVRSSIVIRDANGNIITGDTEVEVGQQLTVTADGWLANSVVTFSLVCDSGTFPLGTSVANAAGVVEHTFRVPVGSAGLCTLRLMGTGADGAPRTVEAALRVRVAGVTDDRARGIAGVDRARAPLARTGSDMLSLLGVGLTLLAVGTATVLAVRRHRAPQSAS